MARNSQKWAGTGNPVAEALAEVGDFAPSPARAKGGYGRTLVGKRTVAYVVPQRRGARLHVKGQAKPSAAMLKKVGAKSGAASFTVTADNLQASVELLRWLVAKAGK
jgi:hypothetical protein